MNEPTSPRFDDLDLELERWIDAICRRFEADWRAGKRSPIDDYLADDPSGAPDAARAALRTELEALECELRQSDVTIARPDRTAAPEAPQPSTVANTPTIAPDPAPTLPLPDTESSAVHNEATLPPRDEATINFGSTDPVRPEAPSPTRIRYFGDYEIVREIARGGMGVVFQARQVSLNRPVALKMILAGQLANDTEVRRFYTEAEAAANLDHPGIVPIFEVGRHEGQHYFSMGFVEGQSLAQKIASGPLPPREAAALMVKVAEAIEYAHQRRVIHRDLKPANILLDQSGNPRVTDFGLAKKLEGDSSLTGSGQILGTPSYMPPEQAMGKRPEVGPLADIYSLGATLYALIIGRPPFQAATPMDTMSQVIGNEPVPPRRLNASLPRDLETICLKCLEKAPGKRYASAGTLAEDLRRFLAGEPIVARPVMSFERAVKWARRRPAIAALMGLVALVAAIGLGGVLWQWRAAVLAQGVAEQETGRAKAQTELAEQRLYDVRMNFVQRFWDGYHGELLRQGLDEQLPANQGGIDRRGFEWYYWQRKLSSGHITLKGHIGEVKSVAFSPDGKRLASAGQDGTVKVWDAATGEEALTLKGHTKCVQSVAFSPDGKRLASASIDQTVKVWDAATGQDILTLKGNAGEVWSATFSPDGERLASAHQDGTVKIWETGTGRETHTLHGHDAVYVRSVAFSTDGKRLASASDDATVKIWDLATSRENLTLKGHTGAVFSVAFSPDGKRLASAGWDQTVKLWDTRTGEETLTLKGQAFQDRFLEPVMSVAFSPDGRRLASAGWDQKVKLWDTRTGEEILTLKGHNGWVLGVAFNPDGNRLASAGQDGTVNVWDAGLGQETLTLKGHIDRVDRVSFGSNGKRLASASVDQTVKIWDLATGQETLTLKGHNGRVLDVAFRPDGKRLATAGQDGTVKVWDTGTGQETRILIGHIDSVIRVSFGPNGKLLASASIDRTVKIWDLATGQETRTLEGHNKPVLAVAYSPDGKRLASAGLDGMVKVWDTATWRETLTLTLNANLRTRNINDVVFSPDGKQLALAFLDRTVTVCDVATGQETLTLKGHTQSVQSVSFSPDGKRLASASVDKTVKIWDLATGQETLTLKGHNGWVLGVAFSPDGKRLASAGVDRRVKLWDAGPMDDEPAKTRPSPR